MPRTSLTRSLLLVALFALLLGGCQSKATPPSWEPPTKPEPSENVCGWPDYCNFLPQNARTMLGEILERAEAALPEEGILPEDLEAIRMRVEACLLPDLANKAGKQVCHLQGPKPCDELQGIWQKAMLKQEHMKPQAVQGHWGTIRQELDLFPTGN